MKKYIAEGMKIVVTEDFRVFVKSDKKQTCSNRNINSVAGGKWEQKSGYFFKYVSLDQWLEKIGAVESEFRVGVKF